MTWTPPAYSEVKMDAEFSSYVADLPEDPQQPDVSTASVEEEQ